MEILVDCTAVGVGRRIDILKALSERTGFPLVVPTGVYRDPWIPPWVSEMDEDDQVVWMKGELEHQIEKTGVRAGWVKLSAGLGSQILLSHDRGWYDPAQPGGRPVWGSYDEGDPKPFTYLSEEFLPRLLSEGVDEKTVRQLTLENSFRAFARF